MRFKTLEIQGFKSFPDKTTLTFDSRTTAVVGSNGNGKSNISDALRWVMGEQGAKALRGAQMEDVIFHGTQTRKSMGYAKVTLTIDNADGLLNVDSAVSDAVEENDMNPAREVIITRKLYRTGESEYLINGRKSRLKDVHTLFMGTGLGRDGYSIIGQGRIDEIVNSKPASRREIFEEAAGVSKFLFKKKGAERELERTQDNLLRLLDIENELKERLPKLEQQADKANKAFALKESERLLSVALSVRELDEIDKDNEQTLNAILLNQGEYEHFEREIAELENEVEVVGENKRELLAQTDSLRRKGETARDSVALANTEIAVMQGEIAHNDSRVESVREQIALSEKSGDEIASQIAALQLRTNGVEEEIATVEKASAAKTSSLADLDAQSADLDSEQAKAAEEIAQLYTAKSAARIYVNRAEESIADLREQLTQATAMVENQAVERTRLETSRDELKSELDATLTEKSETENKLSGYSRLYESKAAKSDEAREVYEKLKNEQNQVKTRLDVLGEVESSMDGYYDGVKAVLQAVKGGRFGSGSVFGTVADVIKVKKQYSLAVETALDSALQHIIVSNESVAKRCIAFLKDAKAGRATFLPLNTIKGKSLNEIFDDDDGFIGVGHEIIDYADEYSEIVKSLLGRTVFAEDIDAATVIAKKHGFKFKVVTLDGQVINAGGSFTGGSAKKSKGIISRKQEILELRVRMEELTGKTEPARIAHERLAAECAKMKLECEGMQESLVRLSGEELRLNAEHNGACEILASFAQHAAQSAQVMQTCEEKIASELTAIAEHNKDLSKVESDLAAKETLASEKGEQLKAVVNQRREIVDSVSELNMQKLAKLKDIENFAAQIAHLDKTREDAGKNREVYLSEIETLESKNAHLTSSIAAKHSEIEQINAQLGESKDEIADVSSKIEACEKRVTEINTDIREKIAHKEKFSNALATALERKTTLSAKAEEIKALLFDEYEMTYSEAVEFAQGQTQITDMKASKAELTTLRRKLDALGDVNYAAITEFREESSRYKDLSEQLADVRKAKRELEKLIDELTQDIRTRFLSAFGEISGHFSRIFAEIFGGGEARLELVNAPENAENADENSGEHANSSDVLAAGVEIFAAPPGKLSKNLMALSGGEKALVAITLYFALLLYRPTPFCMLDEVDAALDEVNVVKYINYLKRYADSTQLMMITHRRPTIEGCDVLYGVFMQEKGVSRLLKQEVG